MSHLHPTYDPATAGTATLLHNENSSNHFRDGRHAAVAQGWTAPTAATSEETSTIINQHQAGGYQHPYEGGNQNNGNQNPRSHYDQDDDSGAFNLLPRGHPLATALQSLPAGWSLPETVTSGSTQQRISAMSSRTNITFLSFIAAVCVM
jgi:hypothetical protein